MARALSDDLGLLVLQASSDGLSARQAATRFGVGISTAIRWIGRAKLGERSARAQGWRRGSCLDPHESFVVAMIEAQKDITLNEMVLRLANEVGLQIGRSALSNWLGRRGWTL
jgi:transposase